MLFIIGQGALLESYMQAEIHFHAIDVVIYKMFILSE